MPHTVVPDSAIAELLAVAAESAKMPLQKALRKASLKALFWEEQEASTLLEQKRSLTDELPRVSTSLDRIIRRWINDTTDVPKPPEIRRGFLALTEARTLPARSAAPQVKGDLQMHTVWSDGPGTIEEMARAAIDRGYEYIAITNLSKGLKIAGGIDEQQLDRQAEDMEKVNGSLRGFRVLRSVELNPDPRGKSDIALRNPDIQIVGHPTDRSPNPP